MDSVTAKEWLNGSWPFLSMLIVQLFNTGLQLLSRVVLDQGTFIFALMTYRHIVAAFSIVPFTLYFERGRSVELNKYVWFWLFLNALIGITMAIGLYYYGLKYTTATYAVNFLNLIPVVTFVFSFLMGIEKLKLNTKAGKIKMLGAIMCVGGAMTTGLFRGKGFRIDNHRAHVLHHSGQPYNNNSTDYGRGTVMLACSCLSYATWFIIQVRLMKKYPLKYRATMYTCVIAAFQSAIAGVCLNRDKNAWRLGWNLQLLTIVYSGTISTAATLCLISRVVAKQGPTYPPMFNPLSLIFVAIFEALIFGELIHLGTILGVILIVTGLYTFLWGRGKSSDSLPRLNPAAAGMTSSTGTVTPASVDSDNVVQIANGEEHGPMDATLKRWRSYCFNIIYIN